jgi:hypothetical protein
VSDEYTPLDVDAEIAQWREDLGADHLLRVDVMRVEPGHRVTLVGIHDELPSIEDIAAEYGGGRYQLKVRRPDERGRLKYATAVTIAIGGPPKRLPRMQNPDPEPDRLEATVKKLLGPIERRLAALEGGRRSNTER